MHFLLEKKKVINYLVNEYDEKVLSLVNKIKESNGFNVLLR